MEVTFKDLNLALDLGLKRGMTMDQIRPYLPQIQKYIKERITLSADGQVHPIQFLEPGLMELKIDVFLECFFEVPTMKPIPKFIDVEYNMLFDKDPDHVGMALIGHHWKAGIISNEGKPSLFFNQTDRKGQLDLTSNSTWKGFVKMIKLGMYNTFIGADHIFFLLALLFPCAVRRRQNPDGSWGWEAVNDMKTALSNAFGVISWFVLGLVLTLSAATLTGVNLPPLLVECTIALSIALIGWSIVRPIFQGKEWLVALIFGLFHGLGYALLLAKKGLKDEFIPLSVLGFDIGIIVAFLIIIALVFPLLYFLRKRANYSKFIYYAGVLFILIGLYIFIERAFDTNLYIDEYIIKVFKKIRSILR